MSTENERERTRARNLAEALRANVQSLTEELMDRNINAIASELLASPDATGGFGLRFSVAIIGEKVGVDVAISWSRKFTDKEEASFPLADPSRPELPGIENDYKVTIKTGDMVIDTSTVALKRSGKRLSEKAD